MIKRGGEVTKLIGVGVAVGVAVWMITRGLGKAADAVVEGAKGAGSLINPASTGNVINRAIGAVGDVLDDGVDDDSFTLGGAIFDIFNPSSIEMIEREQRRLEEERRAAIDN